MCYYFFARQNINFILMQYPICLSVTDLARNKNNKL